MPIGIRSFITNAVIAFCLTSLLKAQNTVEDHLVPFKLYFGVNETEYCQILATKLLTTRADCGRMLLVPPEDGESSVAIYSVKSKRSGRHFRVTYLQAAQNIWAQKTKEARFAVPVDRSDATIPDNVALRVCEAWRQMLLRTAPYRETPPVVVDSTVTAFSITGADHEQRQGQLPVNGGKRTAALQKIGELLATYCKSKESERGSVAKQIEDNANELLLDMKNSSSTR